MAFFYFLEITSNLLPKYHEAFLYFTLCVDYII